MYFFYSKRPPTPAKTEVLHEKNVFFLLKKTTQPRKKLKFGMKKCQKIDKKIDQKMKNHLKNPKFCMKNWKSSYLLGFWKKKMSTPNFTKALLVGWAQNVSEDWKRLVPTGFRIAIIKLVFYLIYQQI